MITDKLIKLVSHYESLHDGDLSHIGLQPKMDPIGIWTEGYGKVILDRDGKMIRGAENKEKAYSYHKLNTIEDATKMLKVDLELFAKQIDKLKLDLTQNQYEALISFSYNVGFGSLAKSTLLKRIIAKDTPANIEHAFMMWNKAGGKVLKGLSFRRQSEAMLFNTGEVKFFN